MGIDKKGAVTDLFLMAIFGFLAVVIFAVLIYMVGQVTSAFTGFTTTNQLNLTAYAETAITPINDAMPIFRWGALGMFGALMISFIVSNAIIKTHPAALIGYVFLLGILIIFSAVLSNGYESLRLLPNLGSEITQFTGMDYILLNLPYVMGIIGVIGGIFLFIRLPGAENGGI